MHLTIFALVHCAFELFRRLVRSSDAGVPFLLHVARNKDSWNQQAESMLYSISMTTVWADLNITSDQWMQYTRNG